MGRPVRIRALSGTERDAWDAGMVVMGSQGNVQRVRLEDKRARLLVMALVDEDGQRLFDDRDVKALGAKNGTVLDRLYAIASDLSGLNPQAVEAAAGNSAAAPSGASTTD